MTPQKTPIQEQAILHLSEEKHVVDPRTAFLTLENIAVHLPVIGDITDKLKFEAFIKNENPALVKKLLSLAHEYLVKEASYRGSWFKAFLDGLRYVGDYIGDSLKAERDYVALYIMNKMDSLMRTRVLLNRVHKVDLRTTSFFSTLFQEAGEACGPCWERAHGAFHASKELVKPNIYLWMWQPTLPTTCSWGLLDRKTLVKHWFKPEKRHQPCRVHLAVDSTYVDTDVGTHMIDCPVCSKALAEYVSRVKETQ